MSWSNHASGTCSLTWLRAAHHLPQNRYDIQVRGTANSRISGHVYGPLRQNKRRSVYLGTCIGGIRTGRKTVVSITPDYCHRRFQATAAGASGCHHTGRSHHLPAGMSRTSREGQHLENPDIHGGDQEGCREVNTPPNPSEAGSAHHHGNRRLPWHRLTRRVADNKPQ